jgi:hypothetical protein
VANEAGHLPGVQKIVRIPGVETPLGGMEELKEVHPARVDGVAIMQQL